MINMAPEGWIVDFLENICESITVGHVGSTSEFYRNEGILFLRTGNLNSGKIVLDDIKFVTKEFHQALAKSKLREGDVLVSRVGYTGNAAIVPKGFPEANCANIIIIRSSSGIYPEYLHTFINSPVASQQNAAFTIGSAQAVLNIGSIKKLRAVIPTYPEQKKIATILSSVDDVIEKTRAQIDKLKDLKTGMMQELLTKGIGHTEFKDSPVGSIPVSWNVVSVGELLEFKNGLNKEKKYFGRGNPIVNFNDVFHKSGIHASELAGKVELTENEHERFNVQKGDVFFTRTSEIPEEIGMSAVFLDEAMNVSFSGFVLRGRPTNNKLEIQFCKYCFSSEYIRRQIISSCSYTTRALTNGTLISNCLIAIPPKSEQLKIALIIDSITARIEKTILKLNAVKNNKKALMQDLLTGKVRVNNNQESSEYVQSA